MNWISVEDRLPELRSGILFVEKINGEIPIVTIGWLQGCRPNIWYCSEDKTASRGQVTHWMPLPDPPKEEA